MKVRVLLAFALVTAISSVASAQVTLTDPSSGVTLTVAGEWSIADHEGSSVAVNEEGCMMALTVVPAAQAEAAVNDLDSFLSGLIEDPVVAEAGTDETGNSFAATGTGTVEGEGVQWAVASAVEGDFFALVFAAATESAAVCPGEMEQALNAL